MTNKSCLVYETLGKVSDLKVMESKSDGLMRLEGVFGVCGVKNQNNRVYDKQNYAQMVESLQKTIKESGCPGELEHPNSMNITLENVSHKIESIQMNEDGTITGTIALLNTPKGQIAQAIVEGGLPLYISSRGAGTITNEGKVTLSTIKTYDLVGTPGFSQAKLNLKENQTLECLNESMNDGNIMYAIVEDDEDKNKDTAKDEKKDSNKDDNKNNDNENIDMKDLKDAIDKLTDKVTSLEAELHVAQESLEDVSPVNYDAIQKWVVEEFGNDFKTQILESINNSENMDSIEEMLDDKINNAIDTIANGVQNWVTEEFAPEVQNWVCEEFAPEVQNWVCEEFAPEVQNWVVEEFAPEVQNWIVEEYSPEVQNWVVEEFSPEVQNWITEEFAPVIDQWVNEEFAPEHMETIEKKVNENVSAFLAENKAGRLDEIDSLLETISANNTPLDQIVKESNEDDKWKNVYVVEHMPSQYKPSWELLNEDKKNEIVRSSRMYDFTKDGVLESFWSTVDFGKKEEKNINENVDPIQSYQQNVLAQMMRLRKF